MAGEEETSQQSQKKKEDAQKAYDALQVLIQHRADIFASLQKIFDKISKEMTPSNVGRFVFSMDRVVTLQGKMDDIRREIIRLNLELAEKFRAQIDKPQEQFDVLVDNCQALYLQNKEKAEAKSSSPASGTASNQPESKINNHQVKLPRLELPKFAGKLRDWSAFHSLFETSIHGSRSLSDIEKFQYLLSRLEGEAKQLVGTLEMTAENYAVAWDALCLRYNNERRHIHYHLSSFLELPDAPQNTALPGLLSKVREHMNALTALKRNENEYSLLLTTVIIQKLSFGIRRRFEDSREDSTKYPEFKELETFLQAECAQMDNYKSKANNDSNAKPAYNKGGSSRNFVSTGGKNPNKDGKKNSSSRCDICNQSHRITQCEKFKELPTAAREKKIKEAKRCTNCFSNSHQEVKDCESKFTCRVCNKNHHTMLHPSDVNCLATSKDSNDESTHSVNLSSKTNLHQRNTTILGTAIVGVKSAEGQFEPVRAVVDSAAMSSFLTKSCAKRLGLPVNKYEAKVSGLGDQELKFWGDVDLTLKPINKEKPELITKAQILTTITDALPTQTVSKEVKARWQHLELADPTYTDPNEIDLLIGAELFPYIYTGNKILTEDKCCALESIYGWIVTGKMGNSFKTPTQGKNFLTVENSWLNDRLKKLWEVEEPEPCFETNPDDEVCEKIFSLQHYREPSGRYVVPLMLKIQNPVLPNSRLLAEKRLFSVERKMRKNPEMKKAYADFMREYEDLKHMELATDKDIAAYFIPHQCVQSAGKFRVVFDASMKASNGVSLNSVLYVGPKLQADIIEILLRMRTHKIVIVADIAKMFRQILIRPEDRKYQHILWRENDNEPIRDYVLNTVTYGTAPAPFLSNRTLKQLSKDEKDNFPEACKSIEDDIYVDDWIFGSDTIPKAIKQRDESIQLAKSGGFELKKFSSNEPEALVGIDYRDMAIPIDFDADPTPSHGVLGVRWTPKTDTYSYKHIEFDKTLTKRVILSNIARIYDPLGFITPIALAGKIIIQKLWIAGLDWDDNVPTEISTQWLAILSEIYLLESLQIPRLITNPQDKQIKLVGFSDGSEKGYGATVYAVCKSGQKYQSNLLIAKSKVAPTKPLSIPRLELCGALLLSKVFSTALTSLSKTDFQVKKCIALSDSTTVLSWLSTPAFKLKTYVANRVVKIIDRIPAENWAHVPSEHNPADLASRGTLPSQLINNAIWWKGPVWLEQEEQHWNTTPICTVKMAEIPDLRPKVIGLVTTKEEECFISQYSLYLKLQNTTAWCLRFIQNCTRKQKGESKITEPLSLAELRSATNRLVKLVQAEEFSEEIRQIKAGKTVSHRLAPLNPFLDELGVLRVGGRIANSRLKFSSKHPAILPKKAHFTTLVINHYHRFYLHAGPRLLQCLISQEFWIIAARSAIRAHLRKCVTCYKVSPTPFQPKMGNLPENRVTPTRCFLRVGLDFGGPVYLKTGTRRNAASVKAYICLFVCMATKALHLELVSSLSADAFIAALDRFVSRRGLCEEITSDCGTNFVGANNYLGEVYKFLEQPENIAEIRRKLAPKKLSWNFNPPAAPHFGGIFEAGIKSVKYHLKRVLGEQKLTFEEYNTVLNKIEAILNSRPLCPLSSDIEDIEVLTPAHFIVGGPLLSLPEYDWTREPTNRLSRWQLLQAISQGFWARWSLEYINSLQQRQKWTKSNEQIKKDDIVLIKEENTPPLQWAIARVTDLHPGSDGIARVATVQRADGRPLKRPAVKLCRLPLDPAVAW